MGDIPVPGQDRIPGCGPRTHTPLQHRFQGPPGCGRLGEQGPDRSVDELDGPGPGRLRGRVVGSCRRVRGHRGEQGFYPDAQLLWRARRPGSGFISLSQQGLKTTASVRRRVEPGAWPADRRNLPCALLPRLESSSRFRPHLRFWGSVTFRPAG